MKILGILILLGFYGVYIGKMILQKKQGIQTDQIAKGKKDKVFYVEIIMKIATYAVIIAEICSIFLNKQHSNIIIEVCGVVIALIGDVIFSIAVITMKDSWRAGIAMGEHTKMITNGIYSISRNPAFLGFDCVYVGILLMFFNIWLAFFSVFAIVMLHLQILQEEKYLPSVFGNEYAQYKSRVGRYLGRY